MARAMNHFDSRRLRGRAFAVIEIGDRQRLSFGAVHEAFTERHGDAVGGGTVNLAVDHIGIDHNAVVADDEIANHVDRAGVLVDFDDGGVSPGRKRELRPHHAIGAGHDVRLGVREHVVESHLQPRFHIVGDEMLVVVGNAAKFREGDLFRGHPGDLYDAVFDG